MSEDKVVRLIEFQTTEHKKNTVSRSSGNKNGYYANNPIIINRKSPLIASVAFYERYFDPNTLELMLSGLAYGEAWDVYEAKFGLPRYATYIIVLREDYGDKNDDMIITAVDRITKNAYLEELRVWSDSISLSDLAKPRQYAVDEGANIDATLKRKLTSVGIREVEDILHMTREEICKIPGVTMEEIIRLEKSLASRGLFLKTDMMRFC